MAFGAGRDTRADVCVGESVCVIAWVVSAIKLALFTCMVRQGF